MELVPTFRFFGTFLCPVVYIVAFASKSWIITHNYEWGLWEWCYTNFTDNDNPRNFVNDTTRCHTIHSGHSPGYYEVVRVFSCFALVSFVCFFFTLNEKEGLGKDKLPAQVACVACTLATITVVILSTNYKKDGVWSESDPQLSWCFWMALSSGCLSACMAVIHHKHLQMRRSTKMTAVGPAKKTSKSTAKKTATNSSSTSGTASKTVTNSSSTRGTASKTVTNSSSTNGTASKTVTNSSSTSGTASKTVTNSSSAPCGTASKKSRRIELPIERLPAYEIPREPGDVPACPPPSYEAVIDDIESYASPPSVHEA